MKYEYVEVFNKGNFIDEFVCNHVKITLSNGNIVRVFDNADDLNLVELYNKDNELIGGSTQDELSQLIMESK
jgi:hypothetical protein